MKWAEKQIDTYYKFHMNQQKRDSEDIARNALNISKHDRVCFNCVCWIGDYPNGYTCIKNHDILHITQKACKDFTNKV